MSKQSDIIENSKKEMVKLGYVVCDANVAYLAAKLGCKIYTKPTKFRKDSKTKILQFESETFCPNWVFKFLNLFSYQDFKKNDTFNKFIKIQELDKANQYRRCNELQAIFLLGGKDTGLEYMAYENSKAIV